MSEQDTKLKLVTERLQDKFVRMGWYTQPYTQNVIVPIERSVNAISIKNAGTGVVTVQGDPLQPGDTISIGGHPYGVLEEKHLNLVFAAGAVTNLVIVRQFFFKDLIA